MKKIIITLGLVVPMLSQAQSQGSIIFEETRKLELHFDGPENQQIQSSLPESITAKNELLFNDSYSIFREHKDNTSDDVNMLNPENDGGMVINFKRPERFVFRDLKKNEVVESLDFFGKQFLITDTQPNRWKLTEDRRKILGYECKKAMLATEEGEEKVSAWYTTQIPIGSGPIAFGGLPGLILYLDIDEGRQTYTATQVDIKEVDQSVLKAPSKGKKVTREEFQKIAKARMAEQEEMAGNGRTMIKVIER